MDEELERLRAENDCLRACLEGYRALVAALVEERRRAEELQATAPVTVGIGDHQIRRQALLDSLQPGRWFRPREVGTLKKWTTTRDDIKFLLHNGYLERRRYNGSSRFYEYRRVEHD